MTVDLGVQGRAAQLRERFDGAFGRPPASAPTDLVDLLLIRVGVGRYALRLAEVAALLVDIPVTHLPSPQPAQLGVASVRRRLVPVFDLRSILGRPGIGRPRWLVLTKITRDSPGIGLAFDDFDRHARVPGGAISTSADADADDCRAPELVRIDDAIRAVVNVANLIGVIRRDADIPKPSKDHEP